MNDFVINSPKDATYIYFSDVGQRALSPSSHGSFHYSHITGKYYAHALFTRGGGKIISKSCDFKLYELLNPIKLLEFASVMLGILEAAYWKDIYDDMRRQIRSLDLRAYVLMDADPLKGNREKDVKYKNLLEHGILKSNAGVFLTTLVFCFFAALIVSAATS